MAAETAKTESPVAPAAKAEIPAASNESKPAEAPKDAKKTEPDSANAPIAAALPSPTPSKPETTTAPSESPNPETKPAENKAGEQKPVDDKPAEGKNEEAKLAEAKPAEDKPGEDKQAETKPTEEKPAENKEAANKHEEAKPIEEKPAENTTADAKPAEEKPAEENPTNDKPAGEEPKQGEKTAQGQGAAEKPGAIKEEMEKEMEKEKTKTKTKEPAAPRTKLTENERETLKTDIVACLSEMFTDLSPYWASQKPELLQVEPHEVLTAKPFAQLDANDPIGTVARAKANIIKLLKPDEKVAHEAWKELVRC
jgi:hypothetical protein